MSLVEEPPRGHTATPPEAPTELRVLLVEDNRDYSHLISHTLRKHGFEIVHSEYLEAAIEQLENNQFDAMLLDLGLPDGSGIFTLVSACRFSEDLPIIVLTANSDRSLAMAANEAGAQEFVTKDRLERKNMPGLIRRAIERHHRHHEFTPVALPQRQRVHDAVRDPTTGLANDILFEDRLRQALARAGRQQRRFALMVIQLEGLSSASETCGVDSCDQLLRTVANTLSSLFEAGDTVARVGVASFGIILSETQNRSDLYAQAGPVLAALADAELPANLHSGLPHLAVRVGAAIFSEQGQRPEPLLGHALSETLASATLGAGEYQFQSPSRVGRG